MGRLFQLFVVSVLVLLASRFFFKNKKVESEVNTLPVELNGDRNSDVMIIFLHGYPNTFRMWDKLIDDLKHNYFCVNLSYPNFAEGVYREWGMDLVDIVDLIKKTVDTIEQSEKKTYKKMVVAHDWGAVFTYLLDSKYPKFADNLLTLDIGAKLDTSLKTRIFAISYQVYLAANFLIGGEIGRLGTNLFVDKFAKPYGLTKEDQARIDSSWNYLYYYLWKGILYYRKTLENYTPSVPIGYIYGKNKTFMFHNDEFISYLNATKGCEVHAVDEGHWVMNKNFDKVLSVIKSRVRSLKK